MINFKIAGAAALLALSPFLITPASAQRTVAGHGFTATGGGVAAGAGGSFHAAAPSGGSFRAAAPSGGYVGAGPGYGAGRTVAGTGFRSFGPAAGGTATVAGMGYRHGYWGGGHRYYRRGWGWGPGVGFAAGLATGAALSYPYDCGYYDCGYGYGPDYAYDDGYWGNSYAYAPGPAVVAQVGVGGGDVGYCMRRYRSYDPASGTYLGYDGLRHPCP